MWFLNSNEIFLKGKVQNRKKDKGFPKEVEIWGSNTALNFLPWVILNIYLYLSLVVDKQSKRLPAMEWSESSPFQFSPILPDMVLPQLYQI